MASAFLYYRTVDTALPNPVPDGYDIVDDFLNEPKSATDDSRKNAEQILEFDFPENIFDGINMTQQNNVTAFPIPLSTGRKRINKQDNGLKSRQFTINGVFKKDITLNDGAEKLIRFADLPQVGPSQPYGRFGFYSPNAKAFSLDPMSGEDEGRGYTIDTVTLGYMGQKSTRYAFTVSLSYAGNMKRINNIDGVIVP